MYKLYFSFLLVMLGFSSVYSQTDSIKTLIRNNDTLLFSLVQVTGKKADTSYKGETPVLMYDFKYQYPYYTLKNKKWNKGSNFMLAFKKIPQKGFLYVFSVDGKNNIDIHPVINCDSNYKKGKFLYPDSSKYFEFSVSGKEKFGIWYSSDSLQMASKIIGGMELTMGSFVKRNNGQIRNVLLLPNASWHMAEDQFGFIIDHTNYQHPSFFVLPVLIEMDVLNKDEPKPGA